MISEVVNYGMGAKARPRPFPFFFFTMESTKGLYLAIWSPGASITIVCEFPWLPLMAQSKEMRQYMRIIQSSSPFASKAVNWKKYVHMYMYIPIDPNWY